ncbi:DUF551 domain-containing protein [Roseateles sp. DXS20W]|uniref:DUF551 domain-containing protein n=1 Tax=Pelomonas lactea TaxID=3299030 RepID=A0ABW7GKF6_9BURK
MADVCVPQSVRDAAKRVDEYFRNTGRLVWTLGGIQSVQQGVHPETDALQSVLTTLRLARESHGVALLSDPPQDAWKARGVDARLGDAAGLLERLISVSQADAALAPVVECVTWVKCSDRMPDADLTVYAYLPPDELDAQGMVISAFFDGEQWRGAGDGWPLGKAVTWWTAELIGPRAAP